MKVTIKYGIDANSYCQKGIGKGDLVAVSVRGWQRVLSGRVKSEVYDERRHEYLVEIDLIECDVATQDRLNRSSWDEWIIQRMGPPGSAPTFTQSHPILN